MSKYTDPTEIVQRIAKGDERAETELYNLFQPMLMQWLNAIQGNFEREDICQDILTQVILNAREDKFHSPKFLSKYIYHMMTNRINTELRKRYRRPTSKLDDVILFLRTDENYWADYLENYQNQIIKKAVTKLKKVDQELVQLRYYEGMATKDIAEKTGMSHDNVRKRLSRTSTRLRNILKNIE